MQRTYGSTADVGSHRSDADRDLANTPGAWARDPAQTSRKRYERAMADQAWQTREYAANACASLLRFLVIVSISSTGNDMLPQACGCLCFGQSTSLLFDFESWSLQTYQNVHPTT